MQWHMRVELGVNRKKVCMYGDETMILKFDIAGGEFFSVYCMISGQGSNAI